jgi:cytochrome c oxidase cbb3-type subunit 2
MNNWYFKKWAKVLLATALVIGTHHTASSQDYALPDFEGAGKLKPEFIKQGKKLYADHCSGCHGMEGNGKGPGAYGLDPKPRDFTKAVFKFRSTAYDSIPTDADIERSIREGIYGSSMPSFRLFAENDIKAMAQYLKVFDKSGKWDERPVQLTLPPAPAWMHEKDEWLNKAALGKVTFDQFCVTCHGSTGAGDGVGGAALVDNWMNPVKPADLRKAHDIGSGPALEDVFKAITTGLAGTPMIGYNSTLSDDQRWEVVAYVKFLRRSYKDPSMALPEPKQSTTTETSNIAIENEFE